MKTSTKNTIIAGVFTIIASAIGTVSYNIGRNEQNSEIQNTIQQSGFMNVDRNDSSIDIVNKLLNEYISMNNKIIELNKEKNDLIINNNDIKSENEMLILKKNDLQEKLDNILQENSTIKNSNDETNSITNEEKIKFKAILNDIYVIDSYYYKTMKGFSDSYGNSYSMAYQFDASNNAYAKYNIDNKYHFLTGYVTASSNTGRKVNMTIEIYGDDVLLKKIENINKETEAIHLDDIDISDTKKLTINTYNTGEYSYGYLYIADVKLY